MSGAVEKGVGPQAAGADDQQYDQFVRELVFDQRSKPKDRTKTEEELALEAKTALEKAERRRIRRMNGEDDESSEGENPRKRRRPVGGDDLEDDFSGVDDSEMLGAGLKPDLDSASEDSNSEHDDSDNGGGMSEDGTSEEDDHAPPWPGLPSVTDPTASGLEKRARGKPTSPNELPYTFPCPSSHEEFIDIIGGLADRDSLTVIERIRTLHHPSLSPENPSKLQVSSEWPHPLFYSLHQTILGVWRCPR